MKPTPRLSRTPSSTRVLYRSDAATATAYSARPSSESHRGVPSGWSTVARTLFATARWVCRSGSPARDSRWSNAAASRPWVSTCRAPPAPIRVNTALVSSQARVSATAPWCAASTAARVAWSPSAHNREIDFTGENTRSYPATACRCRPASSALIWAISSRLGCWPVSATRSWTRAATRSLTAGRVA